MKKRIRTKAKPKTSDVGQAVIASLREIRAWQRGELSLTVFETADPVPAARAKAVRRKVAGSGRRSPT